MNLFIVAAVSEACEKLDKLGMSRVELNTIIPFSLDLDVGTLSVEFGGEKIVIFQGLKGPMTPIACAYNDKVTINLHDLEGMDAPEKEWLKNFNTVVEVSLILGAVCVHMTHSVPMIGNART